MRTRTKERKDKPSEGWSTAQKRYTRRRGLRAGQEDGSFAKFDETVDLAVRLGVNPRHADQMVRGALVLPHGIGKTKRVLVFAKGEKAAEAEAAGADFVGARRPRREGARTVSSTSTP